MTSLPIYTLAHSSHDLETFIGMLIDADVAVLVDVRKLPGSRKYPHFNDDVLARQLDAHGIDYRRAEGLTGRRNVSTTVPFATNGLWRNRSFHNYADHALGEEFHAALNELRTTAAGSQTAIFCSEAVWWRCHRRIIADYLIAHDEDVRHMMGPGKVVQATLTDGAVIGDDRRVRYPQQQ